MMQFRISQHDIRDTQVVEILDDTGSLMGVIYPQEWGIRLVSKFLTGHSGQITIDHAIPVALEVRLP